MLNFIQFMEKYCRWDKLSECYQEAYRYACNAKQRTKVRKMYETYLSRDKTESAYWVKF